MQMTTSATHTQSGSVRPHVDAHRRVCSSASLQLCGLCFELFGNVFFILSLSTSPQTFANLRERPFGFSRAPRGISKVNCFELKAHTQFDESGGGGG